MNKLKTKAMRDTIWYLSFKCITVLILAIFGSCSQSLFLDQQIGDENIMINSIITPDSLFTCYISKLSAPLQNEIAVVENAKVFIEHANTNQTIAKLEYKGDGWYRSLNERPQIEVPYRLVVIVGELDTITAVTQIPKAAKAEKFDLRYYCTLDKTTEGPNPNNLMHTLSFTLVDNKGSEDYYEFSMYNSLYLHVQMGSSNGSKHFIPFSTFEDTIAKNPAILEEDVKIRLDTLMKHYRTFTFYCADPIIETENILPKVDAPASLIFSDQSFSDGEKHVFTDVLTHIYETDYTTYGAIYSGSNLVCIRTLSPDLFNYLQTVRQQQIAVNDMFFNPIVGKFSAQNTAVEVHSNINNGYGIFAGYSVRNYIVAEDGKDYWWHKYVVQ